MAKCVNCGHDMKYHYMVGSLPHCDLCSCDNPITEQKMEKGNFNIISMNSLKYIVTIILIMTIIFLVSFTLISYLEGCDRKTPPSAVNDAVKDCNQKGMALGGFRRTNLIGTMCEWYCINKTEADDVFSMQVLT